MSPTLKSTGVSHFWAILGEKGPTDVTQILKRSGKDMGMSYAKEVVLMFDIFCRLCTMHERDRQTDRRRTVTLIPIGEIAFYSATSSKNYKLSRLQ